LNVVNCTIESEYTTASTVCHGASDGAVDFSVENGTPIFYIFWQHLQSGQADTFTILNLNELITLDGFPAGEVVIQIFDVFGNTDVIIAEITEPAPIVLNAVFSNYNGFNISCDDAEDGSIQLIPGGGEMPYNYMWSTGAMTDTISQLSAGNYAITIVDNLGCQVVQNFELVAPNPINGAVQFIDPNCDGLETGMVLVQNVSGGTGTYEFALNSINFQASDIFENLTEGLYTLSIQDENGCEYEEQGELIAPEIPVLNGETMYVTKLGCEVPLNIFVNDITVQSISWNNSADLDCSDCLDATALPFESTNLNLEVVSEDGCVDSLTLFIRVDKTRRFYAPNVFSPNDDGRNDTFYLYGSKEVASIDLTIFNRWGSLVFEAEDMLPEDAKNGWDGTFNGKQLEPGIYVWMAEIRYIDDYIANRSGDVLLIR
jgi:gliding motility-associated-like protein